MPSFLLIIEASAALANHPFITDYMLIDTFGRDDLCHCGFPVGFVEEGGELGELRAQLVGDTTPLGARCLELMNSLVVSDKNEKKGFQCCLVIAVFGIASVR